MEEGKVLREEILVARRAGERRRAALRIITKLVHAARVEEQHDEVGA